MTNAEKVAAEQQATAEAKAATDKAAADKAAADKAAADKVIADKAAAENKPGPTGLDSMTSAQLKDLYARSPQMFKEAGIVKDEVVVPPEKKETKPPEKVESAAPKPKYGDVEINLPEDVKVDRSAVDAYIAHAKEIGLDAKQVQAEIDFQTKQAREAMARQKPPEKVPTPEEIDAANVVKLKADKEFGASYEENMNIARRAAVKFGDKEVLGKLTTSDPVLVKHFWKLGLADAEDVTAQRKPRTGNENEDAVTDQKSHLKARYNHPTSQVMFKD